MAKQKDEIGLLGGKSGKRMSYKIALLLNPVYNVGKAKDGPIKVS